MWAKLEMISSDSDIIYLPSSLSEKLNDNVTVKFGGGDAVNVEVKYTDEPEASEVSTFEKPETIRISNSLCKKLHLPTSLVYQIKTEDSCIFIGPVIGLLLGVNTNRYNPIHMRKYSDRMGIYNQIGGLIYAFSPVNVNWKKHEAFGLFYNIATAQWEYGCFPLPEVIYRRDFHSKPEYIKKLTELTGGRLFNSYRFSKTELFDYLSRDEKMEKLLPPTEPTRNIEQVMKFISRYNKVILKPIDLSRGRGMCIIEKIDSYYKVTDYRYKHPVTFDLDSDVTLEQFFNLNPAFFNKYLIQKYLSLAKIGTSIFDIRVVMQKGAEQVWGCTGIECRVTDNSHLTNISRGGYALTLKDALKKSFEDDNELIADKIDYYCHKICEQLDKMGHHFGELGIDIAVDEDKRIWLIEANVFPSFKGFKRTDTETYLAIRYTPLKYALSLTKFGD